MTNTEKITLKMVQAVAETIREMGSVGAPAGPMYAALMGRVSYQGFESIMRTIVNSGLAAKRGDVYYWTGDVA